MKIILTNWINLFGVFAGVFAFSVISTLSDANSSDNIFQAILASLFLVIGYGLMFWFLFIILLVVLDLLLIVPYKNYLKIWLVIEWLIISSPFIYGVIKYHELIFAVGLGAFFITQLLREKYILRKIL
ncbi:hypothetical protein J3L18_17030 [Mucilaginibacter gossypii]|uniref:hypothetical protein n=1 Tax=Mucilaginibacter gossypii TaxID=551996 RepID=UPI000DCAF34A|nr:MULTISPECIES: hypothetical protein [Mucilaginibacter]QTE34854.1 hypothetical protein J3L18_17030 [Mucilaginibacter gossypii]RAV59632.1 hypothetical protein DIU36_05250 [Mucilaginibacter rubeus]